ncbi:hypothetical protein HDU87_007468 [Geranomyces variabilis]|uniref:Uncharacterized protein n=1 Tax=Geranomyces variabilis TaxID=109894 RepID=A0AAD5TRN5_9FUNG|nr:hypothetical protein HDU87_007468 [Geranomyces variabilis]
MNLAAPTATPARRALDAFDSPKFIKKGHKLVRVGTAAALTLATPPPLVRVPPGAVASHVSSQNQSLVIVNGRAYTKGSFGRSLRKIASPAAPQAAQTPRTVKAISINGVEFVRASAGKKLIRKTNGTPVSKTPKRLVLNGQAYARAKSGNLVLMNLLRTPKSKKSWWNSAQASANDVATEEQEQLMRLPIRPNFELGGESAIDSTDNTVDQDIDSMIPLNASDDDRPSEQEDSDTEETDDDEAEEEDEPTDEAATGEDVIEILSDSDCEYAGGDVIDLTDG